jgi:hypothetical protein
VSRGGTSSPGGSCALRLQFSAFCDTQCSARASHILPTCVLPSSHCRGVVVCRRTAKPCAAWTHALLKKWNL